jgi:hypothetical protein
MVMQTANMHDIYPLSLINAFFFSFWDKFLQEDRNVIFMIEDIMYDTVYYTIWP